MSYDTKREAAANHAANLERAAAFLRQYHDAAFSWNTSVEYARQQMSRIIELENEVAGLLDGQDELAQFMTAKLNELETEVVMQRSIIRDAREIARKILQGTETGLDAVHIIHRIDTEISKRISENA